MQGARERATERQREFKTNKYNLTSVMHTII